METAHLRFSPEGCQGVAGGRGDHRGNAGRYFGGWMGASSRARFLFPMQRLPHDPRRRM